MKNHHTVLSVFGRLCLAIGLIALMGGCSNAPNRSVLDAVKTGEMSHARYAMETKIAKQTKPVAGGEKELKRVDRTYLLDRARLLNLMLGDGYHGHAETVIDELYTLLRTQGINEGKTVSSVLINEDIKTWKGEPFEQAMALCWIGVYYGLQGDWETVRIASDNSLFQLRDFGVDASGNRYDAETLAKDMADSKVVEDEADNGYQTVESNFVLGYLLNGIANQQIGRSAEAADAFRLAVKYNPDLAQEIERYKQGGYNMVLIVEYGNGPQKKGTGPDNAVAKFEPLTKSDNSKLIVSGAANTAVPVAMDVNAIATDLMWNNLEDIRLAKSYIGTALVAAGAGTTGYGMYNNSSNTAYVGLAMMAAGAIAKAGAHADTRYNETVPQRVYIATATVQSPNDELTVEIEGKPGTRMVVKGLKPSLNGKAAMHYIRIPSVYAAEASPQWALTGGALYANEHEPLAGQIALPYLMGGHCVLPPSYAALRRYHMEGNLIDFTVQDLTDLYKAEGIVWEFEPGALPGLHVLDGGKSLATPAPGTTGYARLFGQPHQPYRARSKELIAAIKSLPQQEPVVK